MVSSFEDEELAMNYHDSEQKYYSLAAKQRNDEEEDVHIFVIKNC